VYRRGFAGVVAEVVLRALDQPADAAGVDRGSGPPGVALCAGLQEGEEGGGHEEGAGDVGGVGVGPVREGGLFGVEEVLLHLLGGAGFCGDGGAVDAGVVDEDAEALLARGDFLDELGYVGLFGHVGDEGDDLSFDVVVVLVYDGGELGRGGPRDVNFCAVHSQGLRDHVADSGTTTCDKGDAVFHIEKRVAVELRVACCGGAFR